MTDYYALGKMDAHGVAPLKEAAARALLAGTDMDMVSCGFLNTLEESIAEGKVAEEQINAACRRVLKQSINWACLSTHINIVIRCVVKTSCIRPLIVLWHERLLSKRLFY